MQSLERRLGLFSVITISISSMVASGLFVLPGIGFAETGPSLFLAFILAAITIAPAAMSKAELATAMPTSGGTYVYIERTFGPLAGTVSGLGLYLSILLKVAFALVGLGAYVVVFSNMDMAPVILGSVVVIVALNIVGVGKLSGLLTAVLGITLVSILLLLGFSEPHVETSNLKPLFTNGAEGFISATAIVFISYAGILKVAAIAEEVKKPEKIIPQGILMSLLIVTVLYSLVSLTMAWIFPVEEVAGNIRPIYLWAEKLGGPLAGGFVAVVAILTIINSCNAGVLAGSRFPFAMSRDYLLPKILGNLHNRYLTPVPSIVLSGVIVALAIIFLDIAKIAKLASAFMILIYMLENLCVIVLRETRPQWYKPGYKAPLYPALQIFGLICGVIFLYTMGALSVVAIVSIAVPGVLFYFLYSRKRTSRKGVLGIKGKRMDIIEKSISHFNFHETTLRSQVVVALFGKERSPDMLIEMGLALTEKGSVEVASILEVPEQASLQDVVEEPPQMRSLRRRVEAMTAHEQHSVHFDSIVTHDLSRSIFDISQCVHCDWLLIEWKWKKRGNLTIHNPVGWLKSHLHCNLAVYRDTGIRYIRKIMAFLNEDKNDRVVLDTVNHLAEVFGAKVVLTKYLPKDAPIEKVDHEWEYLVQLGGQISGGAEANIIQGDSAVDDIVAETVNFDLFVLGSRDHTFLTSFKGAFDEKLTKKAACSVLALHSSFAKASSKED